jgi:lipid-A-disaccharide synthase
VSDAAGEAPLIFLVAGEASGDAIGARLMVALKELTGGEVRFAGVGGEHMRSAGLQSLFPMRELSIMGLFEILPHVPNLLRRIRQTETAARRMAAGVVVTIDSPDFCFRVAKRLQGSGIPVVHYVAPQVWAWRSGRARKIAKFLDHLLLLFPFEEKYFERTGLATTFVGHPLAEETINVADGAAFRRHHDIQADETVLAVMPGSRFSEISRHLPIFGATVNALAARQALRCAVIPALPALRREIAAAAENWNVRVVIVDGSESEVKFAAMAASDGALTSSGTATLELAIAGVPMVVAYRANPVTVAVARRIVQVPHIALANIVAGRRVAPEFLQQECAPSRLAPALENILLDATVRHDQIECFRAVSRQLGIGGTAPSELAAQAVIAVARGTSPNREGRK